MSRKTPNTIMGWSEVCCSRPRPVVHSPTRPISTPSCRGEDGQQGAGELVCGVG